MRILVADDDSTTIAILRASLASWGFDVVCAVNGREAWEVLRADGNGIDIAIIDWMMPEMDGLEVIRLLKDTKQFPDTYAILLTCRQETEDVVTGLECGADDYISKPFSKAELRSRIEVGARMLRYERSLLKQRSELERYAARMEELAETRAEQLAHVERLSTVGVLSAGVARRLRAPLTGLVDVMARLQESSTPDSVEALLARANEELRTALRLIDVVSRLGAQEGDGPEFCDLAGAIRSAIGLCADVFAGALCVEQHVSAQTLLVAAAPQEVEQVLMNLFVNAVDATRGRDDAALTVRAEPARDGARVTIEDNGPGFQPEVLKRMWTPFFTTKQEGAGTGLGLAVVHAIVQGRGGRIEADNAPTGGARFTIWLPPAAADSLRP